MNIRDLAEKAKQTGSVDMAQGVIDAPPPKSLVESIKKLDIEDISTYNNRRGVQIYRKEIVNMLKSRSWNLSQDNILGSAGAMAAITSALLSSCNPGDKVLLPEPFFQGHKQLLEALGLTIDFLSTPIKEQPDWDKIIEKMEKASALIVTSPANPTGQLLPSDMFEQLSTAAIKNDCLLIIDEMYREFIWNNAPQDDQEWEKYNLKNTVITRSFSKTFSIPGWRVGFAISVPEKIERLASYHDPLYVGGSTIAQNAVAYALKNHSEDLNKYIGDLRSQLLMNMERVRESFKKIGMEPENVPATYYMIIKHHRKSDESAMLELLKKGLIVTPLSAFFADQNKNTGYIRAHFAINKENLERVVDALS